MCKTKKATLAHRNPCGRESQASGLLNLVVENRVLFSYWAEVVSQESSTPLRQERDKVRKQKPVHLVLRIGKTQVGHCLTKHGTSANQLANHLLTSYMNVLVLLLLWEGFRYPTTEFTHFLSVISTTILGYNFPTLKFTHLNCAIYIQHIQNCTVTVTIL